jgi:hypothetical integral membrane protein (TIGR02206 family)
MEWLDTFRQYTAIHAATVAVLALAMGAACYMGRSWIGTPREDRFRRAWGWGILAFQVWYVIWYLLPWRFHWRESLPLQLCDMAAFVAALAMLTQHRAWRTILYFWGIGLSTQAFFAPTVEVGVGHVKFWMFWISHTAIVGSAVYDVLVKGFRPAAGDLGRAILWTYTICLTMFFFNVVMSAETGEPVNYWYIGDSRPTTASPLDALGPWPRRALIVMGLVIFEFILLWAIWPLLGLLKRATTRSAGAD